MKIITLFQVSSTSYVQQHSFVFRFIDFTQYYHFLLKFLFFHSKWFNKIEIIFKMNFNNLIAENCWSFLLKYSKIIMNWYRVI